MDPNTARAVLRLDPFAPLTAEAVEAAFAHESWERHPSRYPDDAGREAAVAWAAALAEARSVLLETTTDAKPWAPPAAVGAPGVGALTPHAGAAPVAISPAPTTADPDVRKRRRHRTMLVVGIVAASAAVIALVGGTVFGATKLAERIVEQAAIADEFDEVVSYSASETYFSFPAAMEQYYDGRYSARCPAEYASCWEMAVIPEAACTSLEVYIGYTHEESARTSDDQESLAFTDVAAGAVIPLVFGSHEYEWAWITDVRCLEAPVDVPDPAYAGPSTSASAIGTPMERLEAGHWASADTGFYIVASLEMHDDGRLDGLCPDGFARGCWQATIVPERACGRLGIQYSLRKADGSELTRETWRTVEAGEPVNVVFGHDDYDFGWISHVACIP